MTEYEKALIEYGEKRALWKWEKRDCRDRALHIVDMSYDCHYNLSFLDVYREMRDDEMFCEPSLIKKRIINAWKARCKVMKLRKELNND